MLKLSDFFHLDELDGLIAQIASGEPGLTLVTGLDPRPATHPATTGEFLPSGRAAMFRILVRELLDARPDVRGVVVADDRDAIRIPRQMRRRVEFMPAQPGMSPADLIVHALRKRPDVVVIDALRADNVASALHAARSGVCVISQLDTVFAGGHVARHLLDLGAPRAMLDGLAWVLAVQRFPTLCPHCKQPYTPSAGHLALLSQQFAQLALPENGAPPDFFRAEGCDECEHTGRHGDVIAFDVFHAGPADPMIGLSRLPMADYVLRMAQLGHLALEDALDFDSSQFHRTYNLLITSERALADTNAALERKLVELESAHHVLQHRTEALVSLQTLGQTLIASTDLGGLAQQICTHARELCSADRAILYGCRPDDDARILADSGWDDAMLAEQIPATEFDEIVTGDAPVAFNRWPPGAVPKNRNIVVPLRAGLAVPLLAQGERVGVMLFHSSRKSRFEPGEIALLETFSNQAAVALQRTGLIDALRAKISQLEAAQAELGQKERMEHELELARQVQQSVLPRMFPKISGYSFAALNEPARQVGGDFYDVIALDSGRFGIAVADVSGKGMPAALYMALTRSLLLSEGRRGGSPRDVLGSVNDLLQQLGEPNMFVTVFYGLVDCEAQQLTYARAGHDRPLLLRGGDVIELGGRGKPLGLFETAALKLTEDQIALASGDRLILFTDGLTDVTTPQGELFTLARLKTLFAAHAALSPHGLCATVFGHLATFRSSADQFDDMTMLVVAVEE